MLYYLTNKQQKNINGNVYYQNLISYEHISLLFYLPPKNKHIVGKASYLLIFVRYFSSLCFVLYYFRYRLVTAVNCTRTHIHPLNVNRAVLQYNYYK